MKRLLKGLVDKFMNELAHRIAKKTVEALYFRELHPSTLLFRETQAEAARFVQEHMPDALYFIEREGLLRYAVAQVAIPGLVLEFGVYRGKSTWVIATSTDRPVHGFDSFEGLPEDWTGNKSAKGAFSTGGELPDVPDNVTLHKGLFADTLPPFLADHDGPAAFVHVDCDLYSSTKDVLGAVSPRLREGTVIVFDDFFNAPGWKEHEYKAFRELVEETGLEFRYIGYARHQVGLVVTRAPGAAAGGT